MEVNLIVKQLKVKLLKSKFKKNLKNKFNKFLSKRVK